MGARTTGGSSVIGPMDKGATELVLVVESCEGIAT